MVTGEATIAGAGVGVGGVGGGACAVVSMCKFELARLPYFVSMGATTEIREENLHNSTCSQFCAIPLLALRK